MVNRHVRIFKFFFRISELSKYVVPEFNMNLKKWGGGKVGLCGTCIHVSSNVGKVFVNR